MKAIGIPPLLNSINNTVNTVGLLVADAIIVFKMLTSTVQWGIFDSANKLAVKPDSIISLDFKKDWNLPRYPMELGAFQSYNKVAEPYDVRVRMTLGGTTADHTKFLAQVVKIAASFDLYNVVTPDVIYKNANVFHYDYHRSATNGVGLLTVDLYLAAIRNTIVPAFANVKQPTSTAAMQNNVQPQNTTRAVPARQ